MAQQRTTLATSPDWLLPDDTEESIVGAEWHQLAIRTLVNALRDLAQRTHPTWHVGDQLILVGIRPDGSIWRPEPDVSVHPTAGPALRRDLDIRTEGVPALLIEVLSPTTWEQDLALEPRPRRPRGKAWGYLELWGVPEYLTFDPLEEFVPGQVRAWRRVSGRTEAWEVGAGGRYESALGVSFGVEGPRLRVYDVQGQPVPFDLEKNALLAQQDREIARQAQHLAEQAQQLAEERAALRQMEQRLSDLEAELRRLRRDSS